MFPFPSVSFLCPCVSFEYIRSSLIDPITALQSTLSGKTRECCCCAKCLLERRSGCIALPVHACLLMAIPHSIPYAQSRSWVTQWQYFFQLSVLAAGGICLKFGFVIQRLQFPAFHFQVQSPNLCNAAPRRFLPSRERHRSAGYISASGSFTVPKNVWQLDELIVCSCSELVDQDFFNLYD